MTMNDEEWKEGGVMVWCGSERGKEQTETRRNNTNRREEGSRAIAGSR
jgi:hypothetical protein